MTKSGRSLLAAVLVIEAVNKTLHMFSKDTIPPKKALWSNVPMIRIKMPSCNFQLV